ncbi:UDP-glucose/GDP-mannose dehydrogenase family protein [Herbiconiux sp. CPCC 203407]|uniref:UDP-glucose 6-dehydrogenase n=1 Tax=Herbiconiux oxytropis TaxID=2970915 RepID=A0AA42BUT9_9MICO|nr:UDP-glucose/GDP-mannose dehydrogenase family protein [Herbiconiux oxytropis]MCS5723255.1 UDP-glucose/GDP-mannose dehydrogenase family protein [Herbiconiux oxytropis]MCS5727910.1 UDP-glucose/GDP-mannose dehydrogenase family protein [Herbiconiux oxytropis]
MKISVIGCGYLGAVHAASMAELGHEVVGIDVDAAKIEMLSAGRAPFYEPGLPEILTSARESGRLTFSTDMADAAGAAVHFIAVGTPQKKGEYAADLTYVNGAVDALIPFLAEGDLVVGKSTVPVGTAADLAARVETVGASLAWNPEFLREGFAVQDTISPDRLVYGVAAGEPGQRAKAQLDEIYAKALSEDTPLVVTDYATAELVKVAANAFLATKISFINAMAEIAEVSGADVTQLADAIGHDARIGRRFLNAGVGFGGGCLPKDIRAFSARAEELGRGESVAFLKEVDAINLRRRQRVVDLVIETLGGQPFQKKVAVLGLAFKPDSDDVRDSPALDVAVQLHGRGADVLAYDPEAMANSARLHPQLNFAESVDAALQDADVVVVVTEWKEFRALDPVRVAELTRGKIVVDGRNCLDAVAWRAAGWTYKGMGRP